MHQAASLQTGIHGINKSPDLLFKYSTRRARPHTTSICSSSSATRSSSPPLPHGRECNVSLELPPSGPLLRLCDVRAPVDGTGQCRDVTLARTSASPGSRSLYILGGSALPLHAKGVITTTVSRAALPVFVALGTDGTSRWLVR